MTTPTHDPDELVTADTIAERLGVRPSTVYVWRHRSRITRFPAPDSARGPNGGVLLWRWATIEGWQRPSRIIGRPQA